MDRFIREYESECFDTRVVQTANNLKNYISGKEFSIIHMNVRSMAKNFDEFRLFLLHVAVKFDVVVLTETFETASLEMFHIDGYNVCYNEGDYNRNDGVVVYLRVGIEYNAKTVQMVDTKMLEIDINAKEKLKITAVYRSPDICPTVFNMCLLEYLKYNENVRVHVITGDINLNLFSESSFVEEYKNILGTFGFVSVINRCTRPASRSCIDHIFVKGGQGERVTMNGYVLQYLITDHYPIVLTMDMKIKLKENNSSHLKNKQFIDYNS